MSVTEGVPKVKREILREAVASSNLVSVGYDAAAQQLAVEFKNGHIYHYNGVGLDVATKFYLAESKGRFYSDHVRGKFPSEQMTGICPACRDIGWVNKRCEDCGTKHYAVIDREHREP